MHGYGIIFRIYCGDFELIVAYGIKLKGNRSVILTSKS